MCESEEEEGDFTVRVLSLHLDGVEEVKSVVHIQV